jgi:hypothetical protein
MELRLAQVAQQRYTRQRHLPERVLVLVCTLQWQVDEADTALLLELGQVKQVDRVVELLHLEMVTLRVAAVATLEALVLQGKGLLAEAL